MVDDLTTLLKAQNFAGAGQNIFAEEIPAGTALPHVLVEGLEGTDHNNTLDGSYSLEMADCDIVTKAATPSAAKTIAKLIKAFIRNYTGSMGTATCNAVLLQDEYPGKEPPVAAGPMKFTYTLSLNVQYVP